jgi:DnaJ family protein C protein 3
MRIFRIAYFYLPASPQAMSSLKQCLYRDPDSKPCLTAHRMVKKLDRASATLDKLMAAEDWRNIVSHVLGAKPRDAAPSEPGDGFLAQVEAGIEQFAAPGMFDLPHGITLPHARRASPRRLGVLRALCRAYVQLNQARTGERWCDELLRMLGGEEEIDALLGKGEALLAREQWEEAVHVFEKAARASAGNREVRRGFVMLWRVR